MVYGKAVGTLFVGYRFDAKETHFPCAIYLEKRLGHYLSATALIATTKPPPPPRSIGACRKTPT